MSTQVLLIGRGLFQDGLDRVLKNYSPDVEIIGVAETWEEAKSMLSTIHPDALIADYQYADVIVPEMESFTESGEKSIKALFVILDENKMIVYQRQQMTDITIDRLVEAL
jgi:DNA-binding NarL/FixJ family response regulator